MPDDPSGPIEKQLFFNGLLALEQALRFARSCGSAVAVVVRGVLETEPGESGEYSRSSGTAADAVLPREAQRSCEPERLFQG